MQEKMILPTKNLTDKAVEIINKKIMSGELPSLLTKELYIGIHKVFKELENA
jgi:hypothetical protein